MPGPGAWKKPAPERVAMFDAVAPDHPAAARRTMFGYPAVFVNGHYLVGLYGDDLVIRLPDDLLERFPDLADAAPFDPMGRGTGMKGWVRVPERVVADRERLVALLRSAADAVADLPPKTPRARKGPRTPAR